MKERARERGKKHSCFPPRLVLPGSGLWETLGKRFGGGWEVRGVSRSLPAVLVQRLRLEPYYLSDYLSDNAREEETRNSAINLPEGKMHDGFFNR